MNPAAFVDDILHFLMPATLIGLAAGFIGLGLVLRWNWRKYAADPVAAHTFTLGYFLIGGILLVAMAILVLFS